LLDPAGPRLRGAQRNKAALCEDGVSEDEVGAT
jgi:hypothetical protein